jgi:hypothetical protein
MARCRESTWIAAALVAVALAIPLTGVLHAADGDVPSTAKVLASSDDYRTRVLAALKLGSSGDARARKPLETALDDAHPSVRQAAAAALAKLGDKAAIPALEARLKKEANAPTKSAISQAIEALKKSTGITPATAAAGSPTAAITAATAPAKATPIDWSKAKFLVKVQKAENSSGVRGGALATVLNAATREKLAQLPEVYVLPEDATAPGMIKLAGAKGIPVLGVNAALVSMDQGSFAGDVKVQAKVSLAFTKLEIVKASVEGNASSIGSKSSSKNPDSLARLQDMAVDGAVSSAMAKAPTAIKSAATDR